MPSQESITNARASFVNAVAEGIDTLMQQCGYSRDRATSALLREISRGDSSRPNDKEIFDTMKRYGLGMEEASRTIIVSRALRCAMDTHSTPEKAIEHLASTIAVERLLYDSSEEDPTSEDDECPPITPNLRVKPISTVGRSGSARKRTSPGRKARLVVSNNNMKTTRARKSSAPNKPLFRKRSVDEIGSSDKCAEEQSYSQARCRSESVSEDVSAKIAQQSSTDEGPSAESAPRPVRAKRSHRAEDEALNQPNSKRIRSNEV